jgi:hypothetical protein
VPAPGASRRRARETANPRGALEAGHGPDHRRRRGIAHAHHRLRLRPAQAGRPLLGADLQGLQAGRGLVQGKEAGRHRVRLQRPRHVVLLRPLLVFRAWHRRGVPGRRRGRQPAGPPGDQGRSEAGRAHRHQPGHRRVRPVLLPGQAARPRLLLPDVGVPGPARRPVADQDRAAAGRRAPVPDPDRGPLLQAGQGAAPRDRELPAGHRRGGRVHRRPFPPGARRGRRLQQPGVGRQVPRRDHRRPDRAHQDDARAVRQARRPRGCRGDHVAGHARRAVGQGQAGAQLVLPAVDDRHRDARAGKRGGRPA